MSIFQVIALLFALLMMYVVNIHRRKLRLSLIEVAFWFSMWGSVHDHCPLSPICSLVWLKR